MGYADIKETSIADAKRTILGWAEGERLPTLFWGQGSLPMWVVEVGARIWNKVSITAASLKTLTVGQDAKDDILDVWSKSVYGHTRYASSAAIHQCVLTCAAGSGPYTISEGSVVATDGTYQFESSTCDALAPEYPVTLASGGTVTLPFKADKLGSAASTVAVDTITRLVTTMTGVTITNSEVTPGGATSLLEAGADKESNAQLQERNATIWATRNALATPRDGFVYWARTVTNVRRVGVIDDNPRGEFTLDIVLAGDAGAVSAADVDEVKDVLETKVLATFWSCVSVYSATPIEFTPVGNVFLKAGTDIEKAKVAIQIALCGNDDDDTDARNEACLSRTLPVGGATYDGVDHRVLRAAFENAIRGSTIGDQACVEYAALTSPSEYTIIEKWEVPTITVTFDDTHLKLIVLTE